MSWMSRREITKSVETKSVEKSVALGAMVVILCGVAMVSRGRERLPA